MWEFDPFESSWFPRNFEILILKHVSVLVNMNISLIDQG